MLPDFDPDNFPTPITRLSAVTVNMESPDAIDDLEGDSRDEAIAARTWFHWEVKIAVCGTWVADGFSLGHERMMDMLRKDLDYAHEHELHVQVIAAPPAGMIAAVQGTRSPEGDVVLEELVKQELADATRRHKITEEGCTEGGDPSNTSERYPSRNAAEFYSNPLKAVTAEVLIELYDPLNLCSWTAREDKLQVALERRAKAPWSLAFRRVVERAGEDGFVFFDSAGEEVDALAYFCAWHEGTHGLARQQREKL